MTTSTRERILDAALELTARKGSAGTSMRELADACEVNVAALYYHFPSKAELLRSVIDERQYDLMMAVLEPPAPGSAPDHDRMRLLIQGVWDGIRDEDRVWRLLLAESCHHNTEAAEVAAALVGQFEAIAATWLADGFDDLAVTPALGARLVADFLFANMARAAVGAVDDREVAVRASDLASVLVGRAEAEPAR